MRGRSRHLCLTLVGFVLFLVCTLLSRAWHPVTPSPSLYDDRMLSQTLDTAKNHDISQDDQGREPQGDDANNAPARNSVPPTKGTGPNSTVAVLPYFVRTPFEVVLAGEQLAVWEDDWWSYGKYDGKKYGSLSNAKVDVVYTCELVRSPDQEIPPLMAA